MVAFFFSTATIIVFILFYVYFMFSGSENVKAVKEAFTLRRTVAAIPDSDDYVNQTQVSD